INTDTGQLESALLNLMINARDAMPDGGTLLVKTANHYLDASDLGTLESVSSGDYVMLEVSDNGTGMSPQTLAKAFDPFFTTKPVGQGTGLGLSMIYGFAQQSGGHVSISSQSGQGTRVCLYLPRHHSPQAKTQA
ncbi:MAG: sensor histidine kinase/response regulator fusion protein, partial [Pseudomonas sp.]|nr:sensor histidine kinase/response regulator fusion protein [Pseudomonas sp.]